MPSKLKTSASSNLSAHSPTHTGVSNDADHALASIKAWNQLLVARGNRLLELAMREREVLARRDAAPDSSKAGRPADRRVV
jgi:hypothetical protein